MKEEAEEGKGEEEEGKGEEEEEMLGKWSTSKETSSTKS